MGREGRALRADAPGQRLHADRQVNEGRRPYSRADAEAIRAPTLLVGGADTPPPFPTILDALERSIGDVARAAIPGATHLMSEQKPEAFNAAVLAFLKVRS